MSEPEEVIQATTPNIDQKEEKRRALDNLISLIDTDYDKSNLIADTHLHANMIKKIKGSIYSFSTDKVFPFLDNTVLESIIPEKSVAKTLQTIIHKGCKDISDKLIWSLLGEYDVDKQYAKYFKLRNGKLIIIIPVRVEDIKHIAVNFLGNKLLISQLPKEFNCDKCNFHTNHATNYSTHLQTDTCMIAHGLKVKAKKAKKEKKVFHCKECDETFPYQSKYDEHRDLVRCKKKRGIVIKKKVKEVTVLRCELCNFSCNYPSKLKAHKKGVKCKRRHAEAEQSE